jgi:hypothetical protein
MRYWDGANWARAAVAPSTKPSWFQRWGWIPVAIAGAVALWMLTRGGSSDQPPNRSPSADVPVTIRLDKCTFADDGWMEAGGIVQNDGNEPTSVLVNVFVDGRYVDRDYIYRLEPGRTTSWVVSEPDIASGMCTATRG